jgi:aminoglycoside phosphotransferase (APT) family kinase protein
VHDRFSDESSLADAPGGPFERIARRVHPGARLAGAWRLEGGVSAEVTALAIELPGGREERVVVRRYGDGDLGVRPHVAGEELELLRRLRAGGLPVPAPCYADESGEVLATPYLVVGFIEGETVDAPSDVAAFVRQLAAVLARIHAVEPDADWSFLPTLEAEAARRLGERPARLDESLGEGRIRNALALVGPPPRRNRPGLLHGDFWPGNTLWRDGRLAGVLDWEDALFGDPLADLGNGRLEIAMFFGMDAAEEFTARYRLLAPGLDYGGLPYWDLFAALRPAGRMSTWGLDEPTESRLRAGHRAFVDRALDRRS